MDGASARNRRRGGPLNAGGSTMQDPELSVNGNPAAAPDPLERQAMPFQDSRELSGGMPRLERAIRN